MIASMPRPPPPYLNREVTRHGRVVWFVRVYPGPRIRIRAPFGTLEFESEYQSALAGKPRQTAKRTAAPGSLAWLIARYRETTAWTDLSAATRRNRENHISGRWSRLRATSRSAPSPKR